MRKRQDFVINFYSNRPSDLYELCKSCLIYSGFYVIIEWLLE